MANGARKERKRERGGGGVFGLIRTKKHVCIEGHIGLNYPDRNPTRIHQKNTILSDFANNLF